MTKIRFAAVGDNCIDRFRPSGLSLIGGNAVNVAVQLARLGHESHYFGAVGLDRDGARTIEELARHGVRVDSVQQKSGLTAYTEIDVLPAGERVFAFEDFGVCAGYRPNGDEIARLAQMDHVHLGWIDDGGALRRHLVEAGVSVSQDISVNATADNLGVSGLAIAFASAGEDDVLAENLLLQLIDRGAKRAVVTRGSKGATTFDGKDKFSVGIQPVEVVDTTGAGDSFIAGFLSGLFRGLETTACLQQGSRVAACTCMHLGGFPQATDIPTGQASLRG